MTDWSRLDDAYGPADDIPVLFGNLAAENRRDTWNALWSRLCHQGSAWPATWAAVPLLWRIATQGAPEDKIQAVWMARTIVQAATYQAEGAILNRHKSLFKDFADAADNHLQAHPEAPDYVQTMQAMLALSGHELWCEDLDDLTDAFFDVRCPRCATALSIAVGDYGNDSAVIDWHEGRTQQRPLTPTGPDDTPEPGKRLLTIARRDRKTTLVRRLPYVFGTAECGPCGALFPIAPAFEAHKAETLLYRLSPAAES